MPSRRQQSRISGERRRGHARSDGGATDRVRRRGGQMLQALVPALGMHAHPLQVGGRRALHEPQVRVPEHRKDGESITWISLVIVQAIRPPILIVPGQRRAIVREDQAASATPRPAPNPRGGAGPVRSTTCQDVRPGATAPATGPRWRAAAPMGCRAEPRWDHGRQGARGPQVRRRPHAPRRRLQDS